MVILRMNTGWRPQTTIAIICIALLPLWWLGFYNLKRRQGDDEVWVMAVLTPFVIAAVGIGCAIAGARRGSRASRIASTVCLFVLIVPTLLAGSCFLWLMIAKPRFA